MFVVISCITQSHDHALVGVAALVWIVGSFAFFRLLKRSEECNKDRKRYWTAIAAMAAGIGIWATHFIAMLAYDGGIPISFEPLLTALSVVIAVSFFGLALQIRPRLRGLVSALACGMVAATGVAIMHFTGMAAIITPADVDYDIVPIGFGFAIAFVLFSMAFFNFARLKSTMQLVGAGVPAILAVFILHFVAMSATTLTPNPSIMVENGGLNRTVLVASILIAVMTLMLAAWVASIVDRYLTDLRGIADATHEGLLIVQAGKTVEANKRAAVLLGTETADLLDRNPDDFLCVSDGQSVCIAREEAVEAVRRLQSPANHVLEIDVRPIEYRGRDCIVVAVRDLSEKKAALRQVEYMARHDALTGLANRVLLNEKLESGLARSKLAGEKVALIALDLDRFKAVNDVFGHAEGDRILCKVAAILTNAIEDNDTVARVGGDEFVIVQTGKDQPASALALAARLLDDFAEHMDITFDPTAVGVSMGIAFAPDDAMDAEDLRHAADVALYRSKDAGRGVASFFDRQMDVAVRERRSLEHDLRQAIHLGQFWVAYQPLVSAESGEVKAFEALLRWRHPQRGLVPPDEFIPIAEESGSIIQIGEWILRQAVREAARWPDDMRIAVNVSPVQFRVGNLAALVGMILAEEGCPANRLELEITETVLLKDRDSVVTTLHALRKMGVRIAMDDFGTGYSSLGNLQSFPFDKIKIDRSFIANMEHDEAARSIVRAIVSIGKSLHLPVVAEGVETEAQHRLVVEEGCPEMQGFLFGKPVAAPKLVYLRDHEQNKRLPAC